MYVLNGDAIAATPAPVRPTCGSAAPSAVPALCTHPRRPGQL